MIIKAKDIANTKTIAESNIRAKIRLLALAKAYLALAFSIGVTEGKTVDIKSYIP
jgi:hypothetical protein